MDLKIISILKTFLTPVALGSLYFILLFLMAQMLELPVMLIKTLFGVVTSGQP